MLTKIIVRGDVPFVLPIRDARPKDSLLVRSVTGLNPPALSLFVGDYSRDGGIYQGRRVGTRNFVITMELNPNPALGETVSGLREKLYKAFMDPLAEADYLKLNIYLDDDRELFLVGYTESIETEIFSAENLVQVSMLCPDPYLRDESSTVLANSSGWTILPLTYSGTAETGLEVEIKVINGAERLILANGTIADDINSPNYARGRMIIDHPFVAGDTVVISTLRGYRKIELQPVGGQSPLSLINGLTPTSRWLELHSPVNTFMVYGRLPGSQGSNDTDLIAGITKVTYVRSYWGV